MRGFDPDFDDTTWTEAWYGVPIAQVPDGATAGGYRARQRLLTEVEVFGRLYRLAEPMVCSFLYDLEGTLWMSNTPQERIMMYNNARRSWGNVLIGGLGLGLYPQYAAIGVAGEATSFTVIEHSAEVQEIVEPMLREALWVPLDVRVGNIEAYLAGPVLVRYDTVFLDTWETLDAARLPEVNRLRDLALRHLTPDGSVLLWGYRWMVRLFEAACEQLLRVPWPERQAWLDAAERRSAQAEALLAPVIERFSGRDPKDLDSALAWCRDHIVRRTSL